MATWSSLTPAQMGSPVTGVTSSQAFTEAGPPTGNDGIQLRGLGSVQVEMTAPQGETFTGAGSLLGWHINDTDFDAGSVWAPFHPSDLTFSGWAGKSTVRLSLKITHPAGRLALLANGVGHSGAGSSFTLKMFGAPPAGRHL